MSRPPLADSNSQNDLTEDTLSKMAQFLGIEDEELPALRWVAARALLEPVPECWTSHVAQSSKLTYYYNTRTGETAWEPPHDKWFKRLVVEVRQQNSVQEALKELIVKAADLVKKSRSKVNAIKANIPSFSEELRKEAAAARAAALNRNGSPSVSPQRARPTSASPSFMSPTRATSGVALPATPEMENSGIRVRPSSAAPAATAAMRPFDSPNLQRKPLGTSAVPPHPMRDRDNVPHRDNVPPSPASKQPKLPPHNGRRTPIKSPGAASRPQSAHHLGTRFSPSVSNYGDSSDDDRGNTSPVRAGVGNGALRMRVRPGTASSARSVQRVLSRYAPMLNDLHANAHLSRNESRDGDPDVQGQYWTRQRYGIDGSPNFDPIRHQKHAADHHELQNQPENEMKDGSSGGGGGGGGGGIKDVASDVTQHPDGANGVSSPAVVR